SGKVGNLGQSNYSAAKAGIVGMTKAVAKEVAFKNIRINAIQPGFINTAMTQAMPQHAIDSKLADIPLGRAGEPEEVASVVLFLASGLSSYLTGTVTEISGGRHICPPGYGAERSGTGTGTAASEPDSAGDECRLLAGKSTFVSREIPAHRRRGGPAHRRGGGSALASRLGLPACRFGAPRGRDGWTRVQARYLTSPPTTVMTTRVSRIASAWAKRASSEA